jgi:chromosome partitioning protein
LKEADWVAMPNRVRRSNSINEASINDALKRLSKLAGFRIGQGLGERVAYRELFLFGLTHLDLKRIPNLARVKVNAKLEIEQLIADLRLPADVLCDDDQIELFEPLASANLLIADRPLNALT